MPGLLLAHLNSRKLGHVKESRKIGGEHSFEVQTCVVSKGLGDEYPRVVYQEVYASKVALRDIDRVCSSLCQSDISVDQYQVVGAAENLRGRYGARVRNHPVALSEQGI